AVPHGDVGAIDSAGAGEVAADVNLIVAGLDGAYVQIARKGTGQSVAQRVPVCSVPTRDSRSRYVPYGAEESAHVKTVVGQPKRLHKEVRALRGFAGDAVPIGAVPADDVIADDRAGEVEISAAEVDRTGIGDGAGGGAVDGAD